MNIVAFPREASRAKPHQKLIVIDGLLAIKGSANLTTPAWRKVAERQEMVEVVTDPGEVALLNNLYFAKSWLQYGRNPFMRPGDIVTMSHL